MTIELETERLRLRQFCEGDFDALVENHADPELTRFLGGPATAPETWRWLLSMLGHWSLRGFGYFGLEEKATGSLCGAAGLIHHFDWPEIELGWRVFRSHQGRGFATEAARRIRRYAYEVLGLTALVSYIDPANKASVRVAERLDAKLDGTTVLRGDPALVYRHPFPPT